MIVDFFIRDELCGKFIRGKPRKQVKQRDDANEATQMKMCTPVGSCRFDTNS